MGWRVFNSLWRRLAQFRRIGWRIRTGSGLTASRSSFRFQPGQVATHLESRQLLTVGSVPWWGQTVAFPASLSASNQFRGLDPAGAAQVRAEYGVDGSGLNAAFLDTGLNPTLTTWANNVAPGWDFADNDADPSSSVPHGNIVASLAVANAPDHQGVAPAAGAVPLRVVGDSGAASFANIARALEWVIERVESGDRSITVVNLSLSDGQTYTSDWFSRDGGWGQRIASAIKKLRDLRVAVVAASGNSFDGRQGMGFTAILPNTISVSGHNLSGDAFLASAQRLANGPNATDIVAPGEGLVGPYGDGSLGFHDGTSYSAGIVTGAVLLLQSIYLKRFGVLPSVNDLERWLKQGADPLFDPITNATYNRLNLARSASLIPSPQLQAQRLAPRSAEPVSSPPTSAFSEPDPTTAPEPATPVSATPVTSKPTPSRSIIPPQRLRSFQTLRSILNERWRNDASSNNPRLNNPSEADSVDFSAYDATTPNSPPPLSSFAGSGSNRSSLALNKPGIEFTRIETFQPGRIR